jgi:PPK2 family polyphosphate:nucleotide phosphotransferase
MKFDKHILAEPGKKFSLNDYDPSYTAGFKDKDDALEMLEKDIKRLSELQDMLYASNTYSLLIVFQAMDAAGKDGTIKHVMSGINPQGCEVHSFKEPSREELEHDFLWRCAKRLPERGKIGIFNRSYYEEVLVTRVHPELILKQLIPGINSVDDIDDDFWKKRYEQINAFEKHIYENGTFILKFFLHVSKKEQRERFLKRIEQQEKNWKFSIDDVKERAYWDKYQQAFEDAINHTSTPYAPWYIIPADRKWFMRTAVGDIIVSTLESLNLKYPEVNDKMKTDLQIAKELLMKENT